MGGIYQDQPGAPGPPRSGDLWPKPIPNQVFIDFHRFGMDVRSILDVFYDLGRFPNDFYNILKYILASIPNRLVGIREA